MCVMGVMGYGLRVTQNLKGFGQNLADFGLIWKILVTIFKVLVKLSMV